MKKRSKGVTFFGIAFLLIGIISMYVSIFGVLFVWKNQVFAVPAIVCSAVFITAGIGILLLKQWARYLAIISALILTLLTITRFIKCLLVKPEILHAEKLCNEFFVLGIIANGVILSFFTRPKVKEQFK